MGAHAKTRRRTGRKRGWVGKAEVLKGRGVCVGMMGVGVAWLLVFCWLGRVRCRCFRWGERVGWML
jgi:hypothetical protein